MALPPVAHPMAAGLTSLPVPAAGIGTKAVQPSSAKLGEAAQQAASDQHEVDVDTAVKKLNEFSATLTQGIEFSVDDDSGRTVVKVVDLASKEILRQIPSEAILALARSLTKVQGLLIQEQA